MDPTTEYILQKTRLRKEQIDNELTSSPISSRNQTTPEIQTSPAKMSAESYSVGSESPSVNYKKRNLVEDDTDENGAESQDQPSKKTSVDESSTNQSKPRSYYPVKELEELAKTIDYNDSSEAVVTPSSIISTSTATKSTTIEESCKTRFAELATQYETFEVDQRSTSKHVTFSNGNQSSRTSHVSANRWGAQPSAALSPNLSVMNKAAAKKPTTPIKNDSGIESFYRQRGPENGDSKSTAVAPKSPNLRTTPQKLGGLSTLLTPDRLDRLAMSPKHMSAAINKATTPGKVSAIAGVLEKQINTAVNNEKSPAQKPIGKVVGSYVTCRDRPDGSTSAVGAAASSKRSDKSGVDTRSRPQVNKLVNRWEKVAESGAGINPDESFSESDAVLSSARRMFQAPTPRPRSQIVAAEPINQASSPAVNICATPAEPPALQIIPPSPKPKTPTKGETSEIKERAEQPVSPAPLKSPFADVSSNNSSALSDLLDDMVSYAQGTVSPVKSPGAALVEEAVHFREPKPPAEKPPPELAYSVSFYRRTLLKDGQQSTSKPPQPVVVLPPMSPASIDKSRGGSTKSAKLSNKDYEERVHSLTAQISEKLQHISQLSRCLSVCKNDDRMRGSIEEVEAQKNILVATEQRRCLVEERARIDECYRSRTSIFPAPPLGTVTISRITLPFQRQFFSQVSSAGPGQEVFFFLAILKYRDTVHVSEMVSSEEALKDKTGNITFTNYLQFKQLPPDFKIDVEIYVMRMVMQQISFNEKYGLESSKSTTLKSQKSSFLGLFGSAQSASSYVGPSAVAESTFRLGGRMTITRSSAMGNNRRFSLNETQFGFPLEGNLQLDVRCVPDDIGVEMECGYLHVYEDINKRASWNRLWVVLQGETMCFWKYFEDQEQNRRPLFEQDLKKCVSEFVGDAPEELTARPHAFSFDTSDGYSLVLAAGSKMERNAWVTKLNTFICNLRLWTSDDGH